MKQNFVIFKRSEKQKTKRITLLQEIESPNYDKSCIHFWTSYGYNLGLVLSLEFWI